VDGTVRSEPTRLALEGGHPEDLNRVGPTDQYTERAKECVFIALKASMWERST
jgi:hypothetical protein